jgi:hypothetical protein
MISKPLPIPLELKTWRLFGKYLAIVNYDLLERGESQLNYCKMVGTLITETLSKRAEMIEARYDEVRSEVYKRAFPRFFDSDQLDTISSLSGSDIPKAFRIGSRERERRQRTADRRALLGFDKGSKYTDGGSGLKSEQVRGRSLRLTPGPAGGEKVDRDTKGRRKKPT